MDAALASWRLQRVVRNMGWTAIGGVALVIFAAGFFLSNVMPLQTEVTALRERVRQLETQAAAQTQAAGPERPDDQLAAFYRELPFVRQAAEIVRRLHAYAHDAGLVLEQGEYRPLPHPSGKLVRYQILLPVQGGYPQVRRFLARAMRDTPGLALDGIGFQREKGGSRALETQLRLTVFLRTAE